VVEEKMNDNIVDNVLTESLSEEHLKVMKALEKPKKDLDLAAELGFEDTQVRVILNDLHTRKLVSYTKTKNKETGWVTHYWQRREDQIVDYTQGYLKNRIKKLDRHLKSEATALKFNCGCKIVSYENAIDESFQCSDCGKPYMEYNDPVDIEEKVMDLPRLNSLLQKLT
jgi:transcription factor E